MKDPVRTDRERTSAEGSSGRSASLLRRLAGQIVDQKPPQAMPPLPGGLPTLPGVRIDQAHTGPGARAAKPPLADEKLADGPQSIPLPGVPGTPSVARTSRREEEVLRQTTQIAAHLRSEREELERREKALHEQHALLDQEWRRRGCGSTNSKRTCSSGSPTTSPVKAT